MSVQYHKNKQKKKNGYFVFLLTVVITIMIFSMMTDSFAQKDIQEQDKEDYEKECGIEFNYTKTTIVEFPRIEDALWVREVNDDREINAILPDDPCGYRGYNHVTKVYTNYTTYTKHWHTGIVLHRIGNIDTVAGTYDMKFQYFISVFENDNSTNFKEKEPKIDFINMVGDPIQKERSKGFNQTDHYYDITVTGKFFTDIDFQKFPFEKLKLNIIAEPFYDNDANSTFGYVNGSQKDSIQFHVWPYYGLLKPDIPSPGYEIKAYEFSTYDYQRDKGAEYSRLEVNYIIERQYLDSFLKFIFPVLVMVSLAVATLVYPSEQYMTKISLNAIFLLGILLFVQTAQEKIPNTGEMTVFDYAVMMSYAIIVVTIATPTTKWKIRRKYEKNKVKRDDWKDRDRRNHDLNLENLRRTEADIIFFKDKLKMHKSNTKKYKKAEHVIEHLNERRQFLDKLKNIDSKISLFLRIRADVKDKELEKIKKKKLRPEEIRKKVFEFLMGSEIDENLSTREFEQKYDIDFQKLSKKKKEKHSEREREIIDHIIKPLKKYEKAKDTNVVFEMVQKRLLQRAWKKYGEIILKEEFLIERAKGKLGQSAGTIHDLQILEEKRVDVVKRLQGLEVIIQDDNEEMVINDERFLQTDIRETISKNELEELDRITSYNEKYNRIAFLCIGGIVVTGSSIIGGIL